MELYRQGAIPFEQAMEVLKYDYAVDGKRMFGRAKFELAVIYDVCNPEIVLALTMLDAADKILFVSDAMFEALLQDDLLKDVVRFILPYMRGVFVGSEEKVYVLHELLGRDCPIQLVESAEDLRNLITMIAKK
jgi:hypothetical protein